MHSKLWWLGDMTMKLKIIAITCLIVVAGLYGYQMYIKGNSQISQPALVNTSQNIDKFHGSSDIYEPEMPLETMQTSTGNPELDKMLESATNEGVPWPVVEDWLLEVNVRTAKQNQEMENWERRLGKTSDAKNYKSYDEQTLISLVQQGDMLAMVALADLLLSKGEFLPVHDLYWSAASRGSTVALTKIAGQYSAGYNLLTEHGYDENYIRQEYDIPTNYDAKDYLLTASFAYDAVTIMRGDVWLGKVGFERLQNKIGRSLSQQEWQSIEASAKQIYNDLEQQRNQLGLSPFDNQYPELYAKFNNLPKLNSDPLKVLKAEFVE